MLQFENHFQPDLLKDEKLLWTGQPDPKILFSSSDIFLIPFSLMWGGFALFWEFNVLKITLNKNTFEPFGLFGVPFVIIGLYFIFGRFIYKAWKKKHTYYAITNKRVLVLTETVSRNIRAIFINAIPSVNKSTNKVGVGTIKFGSSGIAGMYDNTGMDFFMSLYGNNSIAFFDIHNVGEVAELIFKQQ